MTESDNYINETSTNLGKLYTRKKPLVEVIFKILDSLKEGNPNYQGLTKIHQTSGVYNYYGIYKYVKLLYLGQELSNFLHIKEEKDGTLSIRRNSTGSKRFREFLDKIKDDPDYFRPKKKLRGVSSVVSST